MNWLKHALKQSKRDVLFTITYIPTSIIASILAILISNMLIPEGPYKFLGMSLSLLAVTPLLLILGIQLDKLVHPETYG